MKYSSFLQSDKVFFFGGGDFLKIEFSALFELPFK